MRARLDKEVSIDTLYSVDGCGVALIPIRVPYGLTSAEAIARPAVRVQILIDDTSSYIL